MKNARFEIYRIQLELAENRQNIRDSKPKIVNRHLGKISQKNRQNDEKFSRLAALVGRYERNFFLKDFWK